MPKNQCGNVCVISASMPVCKASCDVGQLAGEGMSYKIDSLIHVQCYLPQIQIHPHQSTPMIKQKIVVSRETLKKDLTSTTIIIFETI